MDKVQKTTFTDYNTPSSEPFRLHPCCSYVTSKVKLPCYMLRRHLGWERRYSSYSFLTLALDGDEWSVSWPSHALPLGKGPPGTHWIGGWVGPRAGLDTEAGRKVLCPCRGSNPSCLVRSQTLYWMSYSSSYLSTFSMYIYQHVIRWTVKFDSLTMIQIVLSHYCYTSQKCLLAFWFKVKIHQHIVYSGRYCPALYCYICIVRRSHFPQQQIKLWEWYVYM
jgi:hypothetical protein